MLLHGFPDTFETWEPTQAALAGAGVASAALALRGYPPSDLPEDGDYSLRALVDDTLALVDRLDAGPVVLVGHDWGADIAYVLAALHPERLRGLVTLADPPPAVFPSGLRERWTRPHNLYLARGAASAWWLARRDFAEVDRLYRLWSPSFSVPDAHLARVKRALALPGRARAAVDYYAADTGLEPESTTWSIDVPTLLVHGTDETAPRLAAWKKALGCVGPGPRVLAMDGVGHWPHLEASERFHDALLSFVDERLRTADR